MCGRYTLMMDEDYKDILDIIQDVKRKYGNDLVKVGGDIYPTNTAPILISSGSDVIPDIGIWGLPRFGTKGVIINARSETAAEKPTFKKALLERRCVIPSTGFYEWDADKQKIRYNLPGTRSLYMAGLYTEYDNGERRYAILTTAANPSVADVHDRMPVVLHPGDIRPWLHDTGRALDIIHTVPPMLTRDTA